MLRVFISYATASERAPAAIQACKDAVASVVGAVDWFRDVESIRAGDAWRREIDAALHDCHAAVALIDSVAFDRPWVRKEVTVFWHRKLHEPGFVFVPIRFEVDPKRFEDDPYWKAVGIDAAQMLDGTDAATPAALAERLREANAEQKSPIERLVEDFTRALGARPPGRVEDALAQLGAPPANRVEAPGRLARGLLAADPTRFALAVREVRQEDLPVAQKLLPAFPFTWVQGDLAVRALPTVTRDDAKPAFSPPAVVVLRSNDIRGLDPRVVPWSWLVRGLCRPSPSTPRTLAGSTGGTVEDLLAEVDALIEDELGGPYSDRRLVKRWLAGEWFVVAIPQPRVDLPVVRALLSRFPSILFVLLVPYGVAIPDDPSIVAPRAAREGVEGEEALQDHDLDALDTWRSLCRDLGYRPPNTPWEDR